MRPRPQMRPRHKTRAKPQTRARPKTRSRPRARPRHQTRPRSQTRPRPQSKPRTPNDTDPKRDPDPICDVQGFLARRAQPIYQPIRKGGGRRPLSFQWWVGPIGAAGALKADDFLFKFVWSIGFRKIAIVRLSAIPGPRSFTKRAAGVLLGPGIEFDM